METKGLLDNREACKIEGRQGGHNLSLCPYILLDNYLPALSQTSSTRSGNPWTVGRYSPSIGVEIEFWKSPRLKVNFSLVSPTVLRGEWGQGCSSKPELTPMFI